MRVHEDRIAKPSPRTQRARQLRREGTDVERRLWYHLRARQLGGIKFRRQEPIGPFIADFSGSEADVELGGGQHAERVAADAARTAVCERLGYRVLRFWNREVGENLDHDS